MFKGLDTHAYHGESLTVQFTKKLNNKLECTFGFLETHSEKLTKMYFLISKYLINL